MISRTASNFLKVCQSKPILQVQGSKPTEETFHGHPDCLIGILISWLKIGGVPLDSHDVMGAVDPTHAYLVLNIGVGHLLSESLYEGDGFKDSRQKSAKK